MEKTHPNDNKLVGSQRGEIRDTTLGVVLFWTYFEFFQRCRFDSSQVKQCLVYSIKNIA